MPQKRIFFVLDLNFHVLVVHYWNPCFVFCHYWVAYNARLSLPARLLAVHCLICLWLWKTSFLECFSYIYFSFNSISSFRVGLNFERRT